MRHHCHRTKFRQGLHTAYHHCTKDELQHEQWMCDAWTYGPRPSCAMRYQIQHMNASNARSFVNWLTNFKNGTKQSMYFNEKFVICEKRPWHPKRHQSVVDCGKLPCQHCRKEVDCHTHQCYINHDVDKTLRRNHKRRQGHVWHGRQGHARCGAKTGFKPCRPLFIYANFEARQDGDEHLLNQLCWAHEDSHEEENPDDLDGQNGARIAARPLWIGSPTSPNKLIVVFHWALSVTDPLQCRVKVACAVWVGQKILSLKCGNITFKDSLCFLPMHLSAFTKTFGLNPGKCAKGYFPHFFNRREHQD